MKVNPFYHSRELQRQNGNLASNSNDDNNNNLSKASDLCDVLLDAVVGCAAVAESHCACAQCAEFSRRFRRGLAKAVEEEKRGHGHQHKSALGHHGHHAGSVPVSRQVKKESVYVVYAVVDPAAAAASASVDTPADIVAPAAVAFVAVFFTAPALHH